jgi:hypothetical protein
MNTILYRIKTYRPTVTIKDLAEYIGRDSDTFRSQVDRRKAKLSQEEAELMKEWIELRIKELVKIKLLIDKEI